jgi:cytoskeletal protein CcmA (bactofilin family)
MHNETTTDGRSSDLLLGAGAEFEGKLRFKGTVRIDARFTGSIVTNDVLVVGEHARIDAEISCGTVIVEGEVNGNITAKSAVELHRSGRIHGNVATASLVVEQGSVLQGEVKMGGLDRGQK